MTNFSYKTKMLAIAAMLLLTAIAPWAALGQAPTTNNNRDLRLGCEKPTDLTVSNVNNYGATFTWTSTVGYYGFEYSKTSDLDWTAVDGLTENTYTLNNLEPATQYNARVRAFCDETEISEWQTVTFTTTDCPDGMVCIGEGTETNLFMPFHGYLLYNLTQQIYTADEIGQAGTITSIEFFKTSNSTMTKDLDIYLVSTDKDEFESRADWIPVTAADLVFSGTVTFAENAWTAITLDVPFDYDGTSNLAIMVDNNSGEQVYSTRFYTFSTEKNQTLYHYSDGVNYDPFSPYSATGILSAKNRLRISIGEPPPCLQPTVLTVDAMTATTATLSWTERGEATAWQIMLNDDDTNLIEVSSNPFTLVNLTTETTYTAKVRSYCPDGNSMSLWSTSISFIPSPTFSIGAGTFTSSYLPFNNYYKYSLSQQIYTTEELGEAGLLERIDFLKKSTNASSRDLDIYLVSTDKSSFDHGNDWIPYTAADLVFSGTVTFADNAWTIINFDSPFIYNGLHNVAIIVDDHTGGSEYQTPFLVFGAPEQALYSFTNNRGDTNNREERYLLGIKNQIRVLKSPMSDCINPTRLAVSELNYYDATLTWEENGTSTEWVVDYWYLNSSNEEVHNQLTVAAGTNCHIENLCDNTEYHAKVRPACDENKWSNTAVFTTLEACSVPVITLGTVPATTADLSWNGLSEGYTVMYGVADAVTVDTLLEEHFDGDLPEGWQILGIGWISESNMAGGSPNEVYLFSEIVTSPYLVTPAVNLSQARQVQISFKHNRIGYQSVFVSIATSSDGGETWHEVWGQSYRPNNPILFNETIVTPDIGQSAVLFRIGYECFEGDEGYVDDIIISATVPNNEWEILNVTEAAVTLTNLIPETEYEVKVIPLCDETKESDIFTFTSGNPCETPTNLAVGNVTTTTAELGWDGISLTGYVVEYYVAPIIMEVLNEDFEGGTLPDGWIVEGDNQDPNKTWRVGVGDSQSATGTHNGEYNALITHNNSGNVTYLITPDINLSEQGIIELSFWYINRKWGNDIDGLAVCYREDTNGEWNELWSTDENHETWTHQTINLTGLPDNCQIGFKMIDQWGRGVGLDDIAITNLLAPAGEPMTLTVEEGSSATLTGLDDNTTYEVRVKANCDEAEYCQPVGFTTPACPAPVATLGTVTATTADLSWTASLCEGYTVKYREMSILMEEHFDGDDLPEGWSNNIYPGYEVEISNTNFAGIAPNEVRVRGGNPITTMQTAPVDLRGTNQVQLSFNISSNGDYSNGDFIIKIYTVVMLTKKFACQSTFNCMVNRQHFSATIANSFMGLSNVKFFFEITNVPSGRFLFIDDLVIERIGEWQDLHVTDTAVTISGLSPETVYQVKVVPDCNENKGSELLTFTTANPCETPTNLAVGNLTATTAEVSWDGVSLTGYEVEYYTAAVFNTLLIEGFESGALSEGWTIEGDNQDPAKTWRVGVGDDRSSTGTHSGDYNALITHNAHNDTTFLVTAPFNLGGYESAELSFWYVNRSWGGSDIDEFAVCYRIGNTGEWNELWSTTEDHRAWTSQSVALTGLGDNYQIGFRMIDHWGHGVGLDDIVISNLVAPTGEPMTLTVEEGTSATLTGLAANTAYEVRVKSNCDAAEYCSPVAFTTANIETFTKDILAYTAAGGWYLIASPVMEAVAPTAENGFLANEYDLFQFDQSEELEWRNHKNWNFDLENGTGYLYANSEDVTLTFVGTPHPATEPVEVALAYDLAASFVGWNLVGNPFAVTAFVDREFYVMNDDGTEIVAAEGNTVERMEGIFVVAEGENETVTFSSASQSANAKTAFLVMGLSQNRGSVIDRAIVRFDSHRTLPKFQLNPNSTKVYIPQGGKDNAVVSVSRDDACTVSTMDVNFKTAKNGTYTLTFDMENVEFDYLHLIDNMTGADVDLLASPTYTFTAKMTDYASRFRLVFNANDNPAGTATDAPFAYVSNGNIVIYGATNDATLQIVDVLGHVVYCRDGARTVSTTGMTAGVYVLRLIDGDSVRTQKMVID